MKKSEEEEILELLKTTPRTFEEILAFLDGDDEIEAVRNETAENEKLDCFD